MPDFTHNPETVAIWLWIALGLFALRVIGQVIVVLAKPRWLPPMGQWQSGLLPYPVLLASQFAIISLQATIAWQFTSGDGWFVFPNHTRIGSIVVGLAVIYFGGMVFRYARRMWLMPDQRWLGGTIPIIFHCVLASFLFAVGSFHATQLT